MFQAIVHAPELRPGARLCLSDLRQAPSHGPRPPVSGDPIALRFGACCPRLDSGRILAASAGRATMRVGDADWHLARCPRSSGVTVPGLVAETWFVVGRDADGVRAPYPDS